MAADFTIADVLAWARTKPADERYCYVNSGRCAVAQFLIEKIDPEAVAFPGWWRDSLGNSHDLDPLIDDAAQGDDGPQTFGAFAQRLSSYMVGIDGEMA
jgi:hypothetical protein